MDKKTQKEQAALERRAVELERHVRERTAALLEANQALRNQIAERLRAEEALRASDARLKAIVDHAVDGIVTTDAEGVIESFNLAAGRMFGYQAGEVIGRNVNILIPEPHHGEHDGHIRRYLEAGQATVIGTVRELAGRRKDGSVFPLELSLGEIRIGGRRLFTGLLRDITERKKAEEALRESEQQLRALLEDRDRIALGLHDNVIQTIYAVGLNLEECRNLTEENPRQARWELERAITDLNAVIRDLRSYITGGEPQVSAGPGLREAIGRLAATMVGAHQVRFSLKLDPGAADRLTAGQAGPVLSIAHEAMSNTLRHAHAQECIVSLHLRDGGVRLLVEDDGVGFVPGASAGQGLGLRNLAERAQRLGAKLEIITAPGRGAHIVLDIPT